MTIRIGYAPGAFDLFHVGHLNILRRARQQCDFLVAGVVSDEMCLQTKGVLPVVPLDERLEMVESVRCVDSVYAECTPDKLHCWRAVGITHMLMGDDWLRTAKGNRLEADFARVGVEVVYFPYTVHTSSTHLRRALQVLSGAGGLQASS